MDFLSSHLNKFNQTTTNFGKEEKRRKFLYRRSLTGVISSHGRKSGDTWVLDDVPRVGKRCLSSVRPCRTKQPWLPYHGNTTSRT